MIHWGRWRVQGVLAVSRCDILLLPFHIYITVASLCCFVPSLKLSSLMPFRISLSFSLLFLFFLFFFFIIIIRRLFSPSFNQFYFYDLYRAIGDVALQPYVTCMPEILDREIKSEDEFLVLASDGLWVRYSIKFRMF